MAEMGMGYGSECHLLRYLGRHRTLLDRKISEIAGADTISRLDHRFDPSKTWLDGELKGLDFLAPTDPVRDEWKQVWPKRGNPPNWDAVAQIGRNGMRSGSLSRPRPTFRSFNHPAKLIPREGVS